MAPAKPKKWAAESLVSETERKATASPEQQKMAGELTAEMLLMMSPVPGGKKAVKLAKKLFKGKGKTGKISDKKALELIELYQKANPGVKVPKKINTKKPKKPKYPKAMESEASMLKRKHGAEVRKKLTDLGYKSKGGYVKKYARGGGVLRKAK